MEVTPKKVPTLCRQCGMHCGINVHFVDGVPTRISGQKNHPINRGVVCSKGRSAIELANHPDRILTPLKRNIDGSFEKITYENAIKEIAAKIQDLVEKYGASSIGVWIGEALGFLQQPEYARRFVHALGSPNYFSADSVCFSAVYMAYHLVKGYWGSYPDFENSKLILLWGTNPKLSYPPYMKAIERAKRKGAILVVIDPRKTESAELADVFVQPYVGTDAALAWGIANYLIKHDLYDHEFVSKYSTGFDTFSRYANDFAPSNVAKICGISEGKVTQIAELFGKSKPTIAQLTGLSLEQQENGINTIRIITSLSGLCGAEDTKGGELWPKEITVNHLNYSDEIAGFHQKPIGAEKYPLLYQLCGQCHSLTAMDNMLGIGDYPLHGLIMAGANPVLSNPNSRKVAKALQNLDLFVSREIFHTKTSAYAHYILPAATFLERSEPYYYPDLQTVAMSNKVIDFPEIRDEYAFWRDLAKELGFMDPCFPWKNEEAVNRFILEPSGISLEALKNKPEGIQYDSIEYKKYQSKPFPTPSGKYEFVCRDKSDENVSEIPEYHTPQYIKNPNTVYPIILITGARKQQLFNSRYQNLSCFTHNPTIPEIEINAQDAKQWNITNGSRVKVSSKIGEIEINVHVLDTSKILPGLVQITNGWDEANVNVLVDDTDVDPISGFPNMKMIPVKIEVLSKKAIIN